MKRLHHAGDLHVGKSCVTMLLPHGIKVTVSDHHGRCSNDEVRDVLVALLGNQRTLQRLFGDVEFSVRDADILETSA